ncbi:unnamed protein product, partial [Ixodes persulcatus]
PARALIGCECHVSVRVGLVSYHSPTRRLTRHSNSISARAGLRDVTSCHVTRRLESSLGGAGGTTATVTQASPAFWLHDLTVYNSHSARSAYVTSAQILTSRQAPTVSMTRDASGLASVHVRWQRRLSPGRCICVNLAAFLSSRGAWTAFLVDGENPAHTL